MRSLRLIPWWGPATIAAFGAGWLGFLSMPEPVKPRVSLPVQQAVLTVVSPTQEGKAYTRLWQITEAGGLPLLNPYGVAVRSNGAAVVCDTGNNRIVEITPMGKVGRCIGLLGQGPGEFDSPGGIDVAPDGSLWIADSGNFRVVHLDPDFHWLGVIPTKQYQPWDVAVIGDEVYVSPAPPVDARAPIQVFSMNGELLRASFPAGARAGLARGQDDSLYVLRTADEDDRVYVVRNDHALGHFGGRTVYGRHDNRLFGPFDVAVGRANVAVTRYNDGQVVTFTPDGTFVGRITGSQLSLPGAGDGTVASPAGIAVAPHGELIVCTHGAPSGVQCFAANGTG